MRLKDPEDSVTSEVVGSEQVCLIGQRIVPILFTMEIIGNMEDFWRRE